MRIVFTWITALFLVTTIVFAWYFSQPLVYKMVSASDEVLTTMGENSTRGDQTFSILKFMNNIWAPLLAIMVILWALVSSQRKDYESRWID